MADVVTLAYFTTLCVTTPTISRFLHNIYIKYVIIFASKQITFFLQNSGFPFSFFHLISQNREPFHAYCIIDYFVTACEPEIQPPSKTIDINEGGSYTIEFKEDNTTDIRKCYYISETISGSFDVIKQETNNANQFVCNRQRLYVQVFYFCITSIFLSRFIHRRVTPSQNTARRVGVASMWKTWMRMAQNCGP